MTRTRTIGLMALALAFAPVVAHAQEGFVQDEAEEDTSSTRTRVNFTSTTFGYRETGAIGEPLPGGQIAGDNAAGVSRIFTDLRGVATADHIGGGTWDFKLDGRIRQVISSSDLSFVPDEDGADDELPIQSGLFDGGDAEYDLRELYLQKRTEKVDYRVGRQFVLDVAATKIDGASVRYKSSDKWSYLAFAGLFPVRGSRSIATDYPSSVPIDPEDSSSRLFPVSGGVAAAYRTRRAHGSLGIFGVLPLGDDVETGTLEEQRIALTAQGYWRKSNSLDLYHYTVFDATGAQGTQLTNLSVGVNYRPRPTLRLYTQLNHVDTQTLNISAQNRLEDIGINDDDAGRVQNNVSVLRIAQSEVRAGVTSSFKRSRFDVSAEARVRRRPDITLVGNQAAGDMGEPPTLTVPESRAADVTLAVRDRRFYGGFQLGASVTSIFGIGEANFNGANVLVARVDARKLIKNNTELELDVSYISSDDDTVEGCAAMAGMDSTFQRGCFATSSVDTVRFGGLAYHRFNAAWTVVGSLGVSFINLSSELMNPVDGATTLDQPLLIGTTGFLRVNYRFR